MKFVVNSTATQVIGVSETAGVVVLSIVTVSSGLSLYVRVDGVLIPDFELGTLEELQAAATVIMEALED